MKALFPVVVTVSMLASPAWSQTKVSGQNASPPVLVNSSGKAIGRYLGTSDAFSSSVLVTAGGKTFTLALQSYVYPETGVGWRPHRTLLFMTTDCTGPGYFRNAYGSITRTIATVLPDNSHRAAVQSGSPQPVNIQSTYDNGRSPACMAESFTGNFLPTIIIPLDSPPFYVQ